MADDDRENLIRLVRTAREATEHLGSDASAMQLCLDASRVAEQRIPGPIGVAVAGVLALAAEERRVSKMPGTLGERSTTLALAIAVQEQPNRDEACCDEACNGGACETCRCCSAGWCVTGRDGLPEDADDLAGWIEVAAEHNPIVAAWRADRAALAARTPQPAEPVTYICDQSRHAVVPCSRCQLVTPAPLPAVPDGEDDPRTPEQRHGDTRCAEDGCGHPRYDHSGQGGRCTDGRQKDTAAWRCDCRGFVEPDGEDETAFLRRRVAELQEGLDATADALARAHALNREQHRELVHWTMVPPVPFGEDVPALLDAAADACANLPESPGSRETGILLRRAAGWIRTSSTAEVRAAVAAALGRPTGGEPRG